MTRKILAKTASGTSTKFGGEDLDYINQLLTGSDQSGSDPVDINTTFQFRNNKCKFLEPGPSPTDILSVACSATADHTITLPLLTGNDTFAFDGATQTFTNKTFPGGSAATEGSNNFIEQIYLYPSHRKFAGYIGGLTSNSIGYGQGLTATAGTGSHGISSNGKYATHTTGTSAGNQAGWKVDATTGGVQGILKPRFAWKFKLSSTANIRFGIYIGSSNNFPTSGQDDLNAPQTASLGLFKRSTDSTNFMIGHKGSNGTSIFDDSTKALDTTAAHIFRIKTDDGVSWQWSWDNGSYTTLAATNDYPGMTTNLSAAAYCECVNASDAKNFDLFWANWDSQELP